MVTAPRRTVHSGVPRAAGCAGSVHALNSRGMARLCTVQAAMTQGGKITRGPLRQARDSRGTTHWHMGGQTDPWLFQSSATFPNDFPNTRSGPCVNCRGDFVVLFGDGR